MSLGYLGLLCSSAAGSKQVPCSVKSLCFTDICRDTKVRIWWPLQTTGAAQKCVVLRCAAHAIVLCRTSGFQNREELLYVAVPGGDVAEQNADDSIGRCVKNPIFILSRAARCFLVLEWRRGWAALCDLKDYRNV